MRVLGLTALPWLVVYGCTLVYWPLFYYLSPVFLPTFCYQLARDGNWSILARQPWGVLIALSYSLICAFVSVHLSNDRRLIARAGITATTILASAAVAHATLRYLFSLRPYMDTP